ncbi:MAG: rhodanese-like domain-containing protein [Gemmatimonadota bacterium]
MADPLPRLSTGELRRRLGDGRTHVVDVRPVDAYNGWRLRGEARGGHITGARSLPFKWSRYLEWIEIVRGKGIRPEDAIAVYGYDRNEVEHVGDMFRRAGHGRVSLYLDFVEEWCADETLPMEVLPRYTHLVPPEWLNELLSTGSAPEHTGGSHVLCHTHYRNPGDYEKGHIRGALSLDTLTLESPETWNRRSPAEVREALQAMGITSTTTVVLYGRFSFPDNRDPFPGSSAGQLAAFRCAFIMLWAGVGDVRILNGGLQSWTDAGLPTTTEEVRARPAEDFGVEVPGAPELAVDLPQARAILASPEANLVSVRSWPEYIGEVSGYNYIEKKGRIPGSVWGDCGSDAYHMENYRNLDHTSREHGEIAAAWARVGITPDKHNAFYCGTGWRGSEAFFNAWMMGWPRVSVFDGGWLEWSADDGNHVETGIPEAAAP